MECEILAYPVLRPVYVPQNNIFISPKIRIFKLELFEEFLILSQRNASKEIEKDVEKTQTLYFKIQEMHDSSQQVPQKENRSGFQKMLN